MTKKTRTDVFPFPCKITRGSQVLDTKISKMNGVGFACNMSGLLIRAGETCTVAFQVPLVDKYVEVQAAVIKVSDKVTSAIQVNGHGVTERVVELHFKNPSADFKKILSTFFVEFNTL